MASSVRLHPRQSGVRDSVANPLPQLVQTPSGLAILELQGSINLPRKAEGDTGEVFIGRISFPDYNPNALDPSNTSWMKCVQLYVGQHQRLTGEVKKLPKPVAVIRKRDGPGADGSVAETSSDAQNEDLEVVEIVKYKLVFSQRPEPVGTG